VDITVDKLPEINYPEMVEDFGNQLLINIVINNRVIIPNFGCATE